MPAKKNRIRSSKNDPDFGSDPRKKTNPNPIIEKKQSSSVFNPWKQSRSVFNPWNQSGSGFNPGKK